MKPLHVLTTAAAMLMLAGIAPANAQLLGGGPTQTCEAALGGGGGDDEDTSFLPAEAGENTCCYVSDEYDWYAENGVTLGGSYETDLLQTYTAVECPASTGPAAPAESLSTFVDGPDEDEEDEEEEIIDNTNQQ